MYSVFISKFFLINTVLHRIPSKYFSVSPRLRYGTDSEKRAAKMAAQCFEGTTDRYNGVTVISDEEPCETDAFAARLEASLQHWIKHEKHTIWFHVSLTHSSWIPCLVKHDFKFHHAKKHYVMLYRWLPLHEECNIPPYAHTNLGVGGFVFNENTNDVLVIKEKHSLGSTMWKLPGGYVEPEENLEQAIQREILEETGIETVFKCLIGFRHGHKYAFGCSDIYMLAYLSPCNLNIKKCEKEILECKWMKLTEYAQHPEVHENNRAFARKMIEFFKHQMGLTVDYNLHPITKQPICVYNISKIKIASEI